MKLKVALGLGIVLLVLLAAFSRPVYRYPAEPELRKKAHYLERIIASPTGETPELEALGNAEWSLFSMSYSAFHQHGAARQQLSPGSSPLYCFSHQENADGQHCAGLPQP